MDFNKNVKKLLMTFFLLCSVILGVFIYKICFLYKPLADDEGNPRVRERWNDVLRGSIYSRDSQLLAYSEKPDLYTQHRVYPFGSLFASCVGYSSAKFGKANLESFANLDLVTYDDPHTDDSLNDKDLEFFKALYAKRATKIEKVGRSVYTTLDVDLQKAAWDALGSYNGAAIVMNPSTGEILACVSKPTFDPNNLDSALNSRSEDGSLINKAFTGVYPPGSTFKIVTAAGAMQNLEGVTNETWEDDGKLDITEEVSLANANNAAYGTVDLKHAFINSSNVVFGSLALTLGQDKLRTTAEAFGFNKEIPSRGFLCTSGSFPKMKDFEKGMLAQSGIGQGYTTVSPMQVALTACAVANNGVIMKPTLISGVKKAGSDSLESVEPEAWLKSMSPEIASTIKDYMASLVSTNSWEFMNGLSVAGKTGTADHKDRTGGLATPHSWFVGFAPVENPKVVVVVLAENGHWGSKTAAPIAASIFRAALSKIN